MQHANLKLILKKKIVVFLKTIDLQLRLYKRYIPQYHVTIRAIHRGYLPSKRGWYVDVYGIHENVGSRNYDTLFVHFTLLVQKGHVIITHNIELLGGIG